MTFAASTSLAFVCAGCDLALPADRPYPFRCPRTGKDDADHLMTRRLPGEEACYPDSHPFLRWRGLLAAWHLARQSGWGPRQFEDLVKRLDEAVAGVEGHGFVLTPMLPADDLARALGLVRVWVKDETGNVAGSHKGRHMMAMLLYLEVLERVTAARERPPLAVASCGNAALAAAVLARAAGRPLDVFIPPQADPAVVARLAELGARLQVCPRLPGEKGDPCYRRFLEALGEGALPFSCQGPQNGLAVEGGILLGREMAWGWGSPVPDRLFVQVGGGALASGVWQGLASAGLPRLPRLHAVQTAACAPLERAWRRVLEELLGQVPADPEEAAGRALQVDPAARRQVLRRAARSRSQFMWPWESEPRSAAAGILDDETYDWLAIVEGMLESGGYPVVVPETRVQEAHTLARQVTGLPVCATGSAGLAGLLTLLPRLAPSEEVALLFTGRARA